MNTTVNKIFFALGGFIALAFLGMVLSMFSNPVQASPSWLSNILTTATTSTAVSVTASTRVLATTTNPTGVPGETSFVRVYATICNPSSTVVYLNMNRDIKATVTSSVAQIAAAAGYNSCYEITDRNLYQGSVQASSTAGAVSVLVTDYVQ